jgi:hypothetical protein
MLRITEEAIELIRELQNKSDSFWGKRLKVKPVYGCS